MNTARSLLLLAVGLATAPAYGQKASGAPAKKPIETSVCKIFENPSLYNNRLAKVRGYVGGNFEYSLLLDERCPDASRIHEQHLRRSHDDPMDGLGFGHMGMFDAQIVVQSVENVVVVEQ